MLNESYLGNFILIESFSCGNLEFDNSYVNETGKEFLLGFFFYYQSPDVSAQIEFCNKLMIYPKNLFFYM